MKRTATTLVLLAGLGGSGCVSSDPQQAQNGQMPQAQQQTTQTGGFGTVTRGKQVNTVQGPMGEPIMQAQARGAAPGMTTPSGVMQAGGPNMVFGKTGMIRPVAATNPAYINPSEGCTNCFVPGVGGNMVRTANYGSGHPGFGASGPYGPQMPNMPNHGIVPVPTMGPPGAVAAGPGAMVGSMMRAPMANGRTSINFTGPAGMKVTWQLPDGGFNDEAGALTAPKEYNFWQGQVYRLRLTQILPDHPGKSFYPTLEVAPASPKTLTFLAHSSVPITFAADDFAQARAGNLVVKVVYLPDPANQDFATIVGAEEVVSTRLEPGADPVAEAQRRGTILAVIRMGNIDLENKVSPPMMAPPPGMKLPPPKMLPKGGVSLPDTLPPIGFGGPLSPTNPPGTATVRPPATLPTLPTAPTNLPAPIAPGPKPK